MGKIANEELKKINVIEEMNGNDLPKTLPDEILLHELYSGNFIAIVDDNIVAVDPSLEKIHEKVYNIVPKEKRCRIRYIDNGVAIYGINI